MTEHEIVQAISLNLLRISQWYYLDPSGSKALCERYLDQSKQLSKKVTSVSLQELLREVNSLSLNDPHLSHAHRAERCLTLGVLLSSKTK